MASPSEGRIAYDAVAEELDSELTLADLDESVVARARAFAKQSKRAWPPKPRASGWCFEIRSFR